MKYLQNLILIFFMVCNLIVKLNAQELSSYVISSVGAGVISQNVLINFAAGEVLIDKSSQSQLRLLQGFQYTLFNDTTTYGNLPNIDFATPKIYPNPTNEFLYFISSQNYGKINRIRVFSFIGTEAKVLIEYISENEIKIFTGGLSPGPYVLVITYDREDLFITKKIIKN